MIHLYFGDEFVYYICPICRQITYISEKKELPVNYALLECIENNVI